MRRTVWILSLIAPIATLCFGAFFSAVGSFGFDYLIPYTEPYAIIVTSIGLIPGVILALTGLIRGIRDATRHHRGLWLWGQLVWPLIVLLFAILFFLNAPLGRFWWTAVIVLSLPSLLYGLLAPRQAAPMPARGRQISFVAILSAVVLAGIITILVAANVERDANPPPVLTASAASPYADCTHGIYPLVTLQNLSGAAVTWSAKSFTDDHAPLILTPASGTLAAQGTVEVRISGNTTGQVVNILFDDPSGAFPAGVKFVCGSEK